MNRELMAENKKTAKHVVGGAATGAAIGAASPLYKPVHAGIKEAIDNYEIYQ